MSQVKTRKTLQLSCHKKPFKNNGYSLHQLQELDKGIECDKKQIKLFLEQLKQQRALARNMERSVNESMVKVEDQAVTFASKLEEEKRKHYLLTKLVTYNRELILAQKKEKYEEEKKLKYGTQSEAIEHQLKNIEKECEQLTLKKNASSYEVSKKIDQIRTLRSQRTVFSAVFDQFQKQFLESENKYRKLVIEKSVLENRYQEKVKTFKQIGHQTQQLCQIARERATNANVEMTEKIIETQQKYSNKELQIAEECLQIPPIADLRLSVITDPRKSKAFTIPASAQQVESSYEKIAMKSRNSFMFRDSQQIAKRQLGNAKRISLHSHWRNASEEQKLTDRNISQLNRLQCQKKVKEIYFDLDVNNLQEIEKVFEQQKHGPQNSQEHFPVLSATIDKLHQETELLFEKIYREKEIIKERNEAENNNYESGSKKNELENRLQNSIQILTYKQEQLNQQLTVFNDEEVGKLLAILGSDKEEDENDRIRVKSIENKMSDLLQKYQEAQAQQRNVSTIKNDKLDRYNGNHLELILNPNKITKNTSIYTSSELIQISKMNLHHNSTD